MFLISFSFAILAAPRSQEQAREIAYNHFIQKDCSKLYVKSTELSQDLVLAATGSVLLGKGHKANGASFVSPEEPFYIYNLGDKAFVIVSGDDIAEPILAYGNDRAFEANNVPVQVKYWLQMYADEMEYALSQKRYSFQKQDVSFIKSEYPAEVAPIMKYNDTPIQWDQNSPFKDQCPNYRGERSVAGCVATALGQIMYFHRYPEKGRGGNKVYITDTYMISQEYDFNSSHFNFDDMLPHYYTGKYTIEQGEAVADFTHAIGVAVDMDYAPEGSGAKSLDVGSAMVKYFGYDKNIHYAMRDYFTLEEWQNMLKGEISAGRPVCYAGTSTSIGHQFVFEGYDKNNFFYINWGWAGMSDGYFRLSALAPSSLGIGGGSATSGGFIFNQAMWLGLQPPTEDSTPVSFFIMHNTNLSVDKSQVLAGETVTLSMDNYYNGSVDFTGVFAVVLEDANEEQKPLVVSNPLTVKCGYGREGSSGVPALSMVASIPADIEDGRYYMYIASQQNNELGWSRIRANAGYNDRYLVNVKDGMAVFTSVVTEPMGEGTITADHAIYKNVTSQFTVNVTNVGLSEYFGIGRIAIFTETDGVPNIVGFCGEYQLSLPVGKPTSIVYKGTIEAPQGQTIQQGKYKACLVVEHQGRYYQMTDAIDVEIKRSPTGMANLTVTDLNVYGTSLAYDGTLGGKFTMKTNRVVFGGPVGIVIFKKGANSGSACWEDEIFLDSNEATTLHFSAPVQWEPGEYKASIRYNQGYTNEVSSFNFEVLDISDSLDEVPSENNVIAEEYYSLSGVRLNSKPSKGIYMVRCQTNEGIRTVKVSK